MKKITLLYFVIMFFSCSKNNDENNNPTIQTETDIELVTGLYFKEDEFSAPLKLGNPNTYTDIDPIDLTNNSNDHILNDPNTLTIIDFPIGNTFVFYPNPAKSNINLFSNYGSITDIWIIPAYAKKLYQTFDFSTILNSNLYSENLISSKAIIKFNNSESGTNSYYTINISSLKSGYYKIFVKINSKLYWDNLYIFPDNSNQDDFDNFINYWKNN